MSRLRNHTKPERSGRELTVRCHVTGCGHRAILKLVMLAHNPTACNSQTQTATTTTMFNMVLMLEAMGIYLLIKYNATPTTINTTTRFSKGIF
jgi:hypothetical protein